MRTIPLFLWNVEYSNFIPLFLFLFFYAGVFTGAIIRMISEIRAKHGKDSVNLSTLAKDLSDIKVRTSIDLSKISSLEGKFTLAEDLSDIEDITSIDLSKISSLEGT